MIKAIIIDDEKPGREITSELLKLYCPEVNVVAQCENILIAKEEIRGKQPDLVFLDIQMPDGSGFDLLEQLEEINFDVIFVTAHDEYVLRALRFNAVDYLLKPVDEDELVTAVNKVIEQRKTSQDKLNIKSFIEQHLSGSKKPDNLCIPTSKGFKVIKLEEIVCCEANNTYTVIYLTDGSQMVSTKPMVEYDEMLTDSGFTRVHKSWLINMSHIKEYVRGEGGVVILSNNKSVDVSRRKKEHFITELKKVFKY
ncbi:MAG: DNA-binding response regulator [Bacteroidetes bacterium]|jgi:two-component system LytT family response regulator|nr:DNA-binding response regulator [Bacteroidota bacterium]